MEPSEAHLSPARGLWNRRQDGSLRRSVAEALRLAIARAPHLRALANLVVPALPGAPLASWTLKSADASSGEAPLPYALTASWFSPNTADWWNCIVIDCDHDDLDVLEDLVRQGCPAPTWISLSPESGRFHAVWWLARPVDTRPGATEGPQRLLRYAIALLNGALNGDPACVGRLTKNPWGVAGDAYVSRRSAPAPDDAPVLWQAHDASGTWLRWHSIPGPAEGVQLADIVGALADEYREHARWPQRYQRATTVKKATGSRNCDVFQALGDWARTHDERDGARILGEAIALNLRLPQPMDRKEVQSIARSVTKWMNSKWRGRGKGKQRGVMRLDETSLTLREKQALGGRYGARRNAAKHREDLLNTARRLHGELGRRPSQSEIATASKASLSTVKRGWPDVRAVLDELEAAQPVAIPEPVLPRCLTEIVDQVAAVSHRPAPPVGFDRRSRDLAFAEALAADEEDPVLRRRIVDDYLHSRRVLQAEAERRQRRLASAASTRLL